ncbi:hypothetical protein [Paraflavitalea speifideaquila]|uniref:hypothetical protein n=1 Tax=Paraflavitalea speifideaquila TaxID=3076558 RepID=UPI0028EC08CF|nr:hypothetical protein [Paraflavitalea speifideiaquila]
MSSLDILPVWADAVDAAPPAAFIFHVSRCGSTLLAQLLGLNEAHIVLAETPFLDELLRLPFQNKNVDGALLSRVFPAALQLYGQKRKGIEKHLFIKADSWHLCFYQQLRALYPTVPFILLYRKPGEVIHSQRRQRGMQSVQHVVEPEIFGFDRQVIDQYSLDEYMALVLERYFTIMLAISSVDAHSLLVNYNEPILDTMQKIAGMTGIILGEKELQQMEERSRFHAKYPNQVFQEPLDQEPMPDNLLPVMDLYDQVEARRKSSRLVFQ